MPIPSVMGKYTKDCGCYTTVDYDGEKIRIHCDEHCEKVKNGQWDHCKGH